MKAMSDLGISVSTNEIDAYDGEAFELIYLEFKKAEREFAKRRR